MFYDSLFSDGWCFFYKVVLSIFLHCKDKLMRLDQIDILVELTKKQQKSKVLPSPILSQTYWSSILEGVSSFEFPKGLITVVLDTFDADTQRFHEHKALDPQSQSILGGFIKFLSG